MKTLLTVLIIAVSLAYCAARRHQSHQSHERFPFTACNSTSCLNNGTCRSHSRTCICQKNYYGPRCEQFDFCSLKPCGYPFQCRNVNITTYNCICPKGYAVNATINNCTAIDVCATQKPCQNNGTCTNQPIVLYRKPSYTCNCTTGYTGFDCQFKNFCSANPTICQNGGTCVPRGNDYECRCASGYNGRNCERQQSTWWWWWPWG